MITLYVILGIIGILMFFSILIMGALFAYSLISDKHKDEKEKEATPYHEAGHVILAMVTGMGFKEVTITGTSHNFGFMSHQEIQYLKTRNGTPEPLHKLSERDLLENSLLTSLAGYVAEMLTCGKTGLPSHKIRHSDMEVIHDLIKANKFLYKELSLSPDEYLHSLVTRTREILIKEAETHLVISKALAIKQSLTEKEVWEIIELEGLGKNLHNPYGLEELSLETVSS